MNIFILDSDTEKCARAHCDKHVGKMILESCQLLSTAHHVLDGKEALRGLYAQTHTNHPCAVWTRETTMNYLWLLSLTKHLSEEFTRRFNKVHLSWRKLCNLVSQPPRRMLVNKTWHMTDHPLCMPDQYKIEGNPVQSYRDYYLHEKKHFAEWKYSEVPEWWEYLKDSDTSSLRGFPV